MKSWISILSVFLFVSCGGNPPIEKEFDSEIHEAFSLLPTRPTTEGQIPKFINLLMDVTESMQGFMHANRNDFLEVVTSLVPKLSETGATADRDQTSRLKYFSFLKEIKEEEEGYLSMLEESKYENINTDYEKIEPLLKNDSFTVIVTDLQFNSIHDFTRLSLLLQNLVLKRNFFFQLRALMLNFDGKVYHELSAEKLTLPFQGLRPLFIIVLAGQQYIGFADKIFENTKWQTHSEVLTILKIDQCLRPLVSPYHDESGRIVGDILIQDMSEAESGYLGQTITVNSNSPAKANISIKSPLFEQWPLNEKNLAVATFKQGTRDDIPTFTQTESEYSVENVSINGGNGELTFVFDIPPKNPEYEELLIKFDVIPQNPPPWIEKFNCEENDLKSFVNHTPLLTKLVNNIFSYIDDTIRLATFFIFVKYGS